MKISNEDVVINQHGVKATENVKILDSLSKENSLLTQQLLQIFNNRLSELRPVIDVIKERGYYFKHPDKASDGLSSRGPIIGYNNDHFFVYSVEDNWVYKIRRYDSELKDKIHISKFIEQYDFDKAMSGLNFVLELQDHYSEIYKEENEQKKALIDKYSK
ncbi:MAG: hypothetical protein WAM41_05850 [Psychrobacillus psychrotolerans]|uniref:hypothetical protein n=1 Tax=Psychrobacillus psychrotolerans TaxID=126156 RepID=UPI003BB036FC